MPTVSREERPVAYYARATVGVVLVLLAIAAAWAARQVLLLVLIAMILAVGLDPAVRWCGRRLRLSRGWAVLAIVLAGFAAVGLFLGLLIPPMVREVREFARDIPQYVEQLERSTGFVGELQERYDLSERLQQVTNEIPSRIGSSFATVFGITRSLAATIFSLLTIFVLTVYFLVNLPRVRDAAVALFPAAKRSRYGRIVDESREKIGGYVSGQVIVAMIAGVAAFVFLAIAGVPFAAALATWVAFTALIPTIGATLGAVVVVIVAFLDSVVVGVATLVYFIVYQQVENYVIAPRIMKKAIDLSPAAVIIAVLIGGALLGFVGALLALPIAATAKVVVRDLWLGDRLDRVRETG